MLQALLSIIFISGLFAPVFAKDEYFYLSSTGFLISIDIDRVSETGQVAAGQLPIDITTCGGHIYYTDLGTDQIYDYDPLSKSLNKAKIDEVPSIEEIELRTIIDDTPRKPPIVAVFEKIHKAKPKPPTIDESKEPLEISFHNKRLGLSKVVCSDQYLFVVSTLKSRVDVLKRDTLTRVATLNVGERPAGLAINPSGSLLAVSSIGLNTVYIIKADTFSFDKIAETVVGTAPSELVWIDDDTLYALNRGDGSISILSGAGVSKRDIKLGGSPNVLLADTKNSKIYALDGNAHKLFMISAADQSFQEKEISEDLKYPSFMTLAGNDELLVGSEKDGRLVVLDLVSFEPRQKIQTNLPPRAIVKITSDESQIVSR
ncbi:MAG: hypothetical protein SFT81_06125 [Candidatus Caenarcaniphilales bacterium]|nr:hypothetical protein [Candidatus Caenarcaniphilales bacterium]